MRGDEAPVVKGPRSLTVSTLDGLTTTLHIEGVETPDQIRQKSFDAIYSSTDPLFECSVDRAELIWKCKNLCDPSLPTRSMDDLEVHTKLYLILFEGSSHRVLRLQGGGAGDEAILIYGDGKYGEVFRV